MLVKQRTIALGWGVPHGFLRRLQSWGTAPMVGGTPVEAWPMVVPGAGWWAPVP